MPKCLLEVSREGETEGSRGADACGSWRILRRHDWPQKGAGAAPWAWLPVRAAQPDSPCRV